MWNHAIAHALSDLGHRVTIIAARSSEKIPAEHTADGIRIQRLLVRDPYRLRRLPTLGRYVRPILQLAYSARIDHALRELFARDPFQVVEFAEVNAEGYFYARHPLTPFVVRCHTPTFVLARYYSAREMPYDTAIISRAEKYLIRRAHALTAPSHDTARTIAETTGVPLDRIAVVPNALTLGDFPLADNAARPQTTAPPVHRPDAPTILFVGRLERVKGVEVLAQAIPLIISKLPQARFVFIGDDLPSARGASQRAELENALRSANAAAQVEFLGGVDQPTLLQWYGQADICVVPSLLYESFSYTAAQAMAFGKPVVASRIGGIPETVDDGVSGILFEPGDAAQLADAIIRLARDPGLSQRMGCAGRAQVERAYDARLVASGILKVYRYSIERFEH